MAANLPSMGQHLTEQVKGALLGRITSLKGVRNAAIRDTENGPVITLLAIPEADVSRLRQSAERFAREVGLEVSERTVELLSSAAPGTKAGRRTLSRVYTDRSAGSFMASVSLELGGDVLTGEQKASDSCRLRLHSVAQAALNASTHLLPEPAEVEDVCVSFGEEQPSVLVSILLGGAPLLGAAHVRFDEYDATARAVLDAVNRVSSRTWTPQLEGAV